MYFPYLRGRQYELLALRELLAADLLSERILPIIEPVKVSATLPLSMGAFVSAKRNLGFIMNPTVGSFQKDLSNEKNTSIAEKIRRSINSEYIVRFYHATKNLPATFQQLQAFNPSVDLNSIATICASPDGIPVVETAFGAAKPRFSVIPDETVFRRRIRNNRILLGDRFKKRLRNNDYIETPDEAFSSDHLYYADDGYIGFSDFSVIGDDYSDTGFAPYAVAIHIVYFDAEQNLRVHHFVSDTNDDITDPAGKFEEAARKLVAWNEVQQMDTLGIRTLIDAYKSSKYPGLGTVKKCSIMHHLELIGRYLDEVKPG